MLRLIGMWKSNDKCILWNRAKDNAGYGVAWFQDKFIRAHQLSYLLTKGDIEKDKIICHTCDVRDCVNPNHLVLGTNNSNSKDMVSKDRQAKGEEAGNSKLTAKQVQEIYNSPDSSRVIAKRYDISKTNVLDIKRKKIWRHLHAC
jgi:HNH endonuclease